MAEISALRDRPLLSDIPAMMRHVADQIEAGDIHVKSAIFIVPVERDWPNIFGWGDHLGDHGNIAVCELAKAWFVKNLVSR